MTQRTLGHKLNFGELLRGPMFFLGPGSSGPRGTLQTLYRRFSASVAWLRWSEVLLRAACSVAGEYWLVVHCDRRRGKPACACRPCSTS